MNYLISDHHCNSQNYQTYKVYDKSFLKKKKMLKRDMTGKWIVCDSESAEKDRIYAPTCRIRICPVLVRTYPDSKTW